MRALLPGVQPRARRGEGLGRAFARTPTTRTRRVTLALERTVQEFLDREWLGNPAAAWVRAAIVLIATFLALGIAKRLVVARLAVVAARTDTDVDDLVV